MSTASADVGLVIPTHDEVKRLPRTLTRLDEFADRERINLQIVVVDDGSRDGTGDIARGFVARVGARMSLDVVVTEHRGKGAAVRAGYPVLDATIVGYCDADLSAGPEAISKVLGSIRAGADVAMASRGLPESELIVRQVRFREWGGKTFNLVTRWVTGLPYRDTQCGLKLLRREAAQRIFTSLRLDGFAFDTEVIVIADRLGFRIEEVPISWAHATGSKVSLVRDPYRMLRDLMRITRRLKEHPLHPVGTATPETTLQMVDVEGHHWWHASKRELVDSLLSAAPEGPCLDVGCGGGAMLAQLPSERPGFGVDISPLALSAAADRGLDGLARADGAALPFRQGSFTAALALDSLEHHPRPQAMLEEMGRVLVPGGMVIITVPAFAWMWSYADHLLGHYRRYTRRQLVGDLRSAQFDVIRATYFHSWLLPVAWFFRRLKAVLGRGTSTDDFPLPARLNTLFMSAARIERRLLGITALPFGLSLLAVARKHVVDAGIAGSARETRIDALEIDGDHGIVHHQV